MTRLTTLPGLDYAFTIRAEIGKPLAGAETPLGDRLHIPITGGRAEGVGRTRILERQIADILRDDAHLRHLRGLRIGAGSGTRVCGRVSHGKSPGNGLC